MLKILADHTLPLLHLFTPHFAVTTYADNATLKQQITCHDILLCRSTLAVDKTLLINTPIKCVATASSGIDHIDNHYLQSQQIMLFDAKGCNAHAVADYVASTLAWVLKNHGLKNQLAGIIGMGQVGSKVADRLKQFGLEIRCYDPLRALIEKQYHTDTLESLFDCGLLCIHANLHETHPFPTHHLIQEDFLKKLAPGTVIINASRGAIVHEKNLLDFSFIYCTDVYEHEPAIKPAIIDYATICTPHIAGHTIEAKKNAIISLAKQLYQYNKKPLPQEISMAQPIEKPFDSQLSLIDNWLNHYNPAVETRLLKKADDKTSAFLKLRKKHIFRHDIEYLVATGGLEPPTSAL